MMNAKMTATDIDVPASLSACHYRKHENGLHEFVIHDFSETGVDAFIEAYTTMVRALQPDQPVLILLDSGDGSIPIKYVFDRMLQMSQSLPNIMLQQRLAALIAPGLVNGILTSMLSIFPQTQIKTFRPQERPAAERWLLKQPSGT